MRILSQVKNGKCKFELGDFDCCLSNITDVPIDLLDCLIRYYKREVVATRFFDQNHCSFLLVLSPNGIYIIDEYIDELQNLYNVITIDDFAKQIIADIEDSIDDWVRKFYDEQDLERNIIDKIRILKKIDKLKTVSNLYQ